MGRFQPNNDSQVMRNQSNVQYEVFSSDEEVVQAHDQDDSENEEMEHQYYQRNPMEVNKNKFMNQIPQTPEVEIEKDSVERMNIYKLEALYNEIHPDPRSLDPCSELDPVSIIPQITPNSVFHSIFLNCYGEDIYDIILEELRTQYEHLCEF